MVKDYIKNYAVEAFRFYANFKRACPRKKIENLTPEERADVEAVDRTLSQLKILCPDAIKAVEIVYFTLPAYPIGHKEITDRVQYACNKIFYSERNIYYFLATTRNIFAQERGLRCPPIKQRCSNDAK